MNAFLAEPVIRRQFYFDRDDLTERRQGERCLSATPCDQNSAPAYVFSVHRTLGPQRWRSYVTAKLDVDPGALTPVNVFHFRSFDTGDFSATGSGASIS